MEDSYDSAVLSLLISKICRCYEYLMIPSSILSIICIRVAKILNRSNGILPSIIKNLFDIWENNISYSLWLTWSEFCSELVFLLFPKFSEPHMLWFHAIFFNNRAIIIIKVKLRILEKWVLFVNTFHLVLLNRQMVHKTDPAQENY